MRRPLSVVLASVLASALGLAVTLTLAVVGPAPTAQAAAGVSLANTADGTATIDPTYATELRVSGRGFQSIRGGHGGIYVFFGTVDGRWRPSQGGATGRDYFYVPDSESADNAGYQRYVAFPGSDTASSANGGTISGSGTWSTTITVPGAVFQAVDRDGATREIDCRRVACGVITVGAHGVVNATNETFTPVRVVDLYDGDDAATPSSDATDTASGETPGAGSATASDAGEETPVKLGPMAVEVDRSSARAGNVLSFTASGLTPNAQVTAILDDGVSANGPFVVGADGRLAGVVALPATLGPGTHELRLYGLGEEIEEPSVRFAVAAAETAETAQAAEVSPASAPTETAGGAAGELAPWFFAAAVVVLVSAVARFLLVRRKAGAPDA